MYLCLVCYSGSPLLQLNSNGDHATGVYVKQPSKKMVYIAVKSVYFGCFNMNPSDLQYALW